MIADPRWLSRRCPNPSVWELCRRNHMALLLTLGSEYLRRRDIGISALTEEVLRGDPPSCRFNLEIHDSTLEQ